MKKNLIFLTPLLLVFAGCSLVSQDYNAEVPTIDLNTNHQVVNETESVVPVESNEPLTSTEPIINEDNLKTFTDSNLGVTFKYPNNWPTPAVMTNHPSSGSYFDKDNQWEIGLGGILEGSTVYRASLRGYYPQTKNEIIAAINNPENKDSLALVNQFNNQQGVYLVYTEAGIRGVKNIMLFDNSGQTVRAQSIGGELDADIYDLALSIQLTE